MHKNKQALLKGRTVTFIGKFFLYCYRQIYQFKEKEKPPSIFILFHFIHLTAVHTYRVLLPGKKNPNPLFCLF